VGQGLFEGLFSEER